MKEENQEGPVAQGLPGAARLEICTGCGHDKRIPIGPPHLACCPDSRYRHISRVLRDAVEDGPHGAKVDIEFVIDLLETIPVATEAPQAPVSEANGSNPLPPEGSTPLPLDLEPILGWMNSARPTPFNFANFSLTARTHIAGLIAEVRRLRDQGAAA